jgi:predicted dehydrogenase
MLEQWLPLLRGDAGTGAARTSAGAAGAGSGPAPAVPTLRDGLVVQRVIDAARLSSDGAGWVSLQA